jgi:adenine phosphoribosyltransferase
MINWRKFVVNTDNSNFELGLIWSKGNSLQQIANEIVQIINIEDYDYLACVETKGIIYASAVSAICGKELRIFRKRNKITYTDEKYERFFINWKNVEDGIEIEKDQISNNDRIIIIDDIVDTGITFKSISSIIQEANAKVIKYICIKNVSSISELDNVQIIPLL